MQEPSKTVTRPEIKKPGPEQWRENVTALLPQDWFSVSVRNRVATIFVFGEIGITGHWNDALKQIPSDTEDIQLVIDSPGGDCLTALHLHDQLKGRVSTATITEKCFSAALVLALCANRIYMHREAKILCHAPQSFFYGTAMGFLTVGQSLNDCTDQIRKLLIQRTELSALVVEAFLNGSDIYFTAEQALAFGLVDGILESEPEPEPVVSTFAFKNEHGETKLAVPTKDEAFFHSVLTAIGHLEVSTRNNFIRSFLGWVATNTTETL